MGAVLNFSRGTVFFETLCIELPWGKPTPQPAYSIYCPRITKQLSMPFRTATFVDVEHDFPPRSFDSNTEAYVTKSTFGVLPKDFHHTPGVVKLDDLHNHSAPLIVVNTSDETLQLPSKTTVPQLELLNGENINIVDFSDII